MLFLPNLLFLFWIIGCNPPEQKADQDLQSSNSKVKMVAAMKDVMWRGELGSKIDLDTISDREGLFGIGPLVGLRGELMIYDGKCFVSRADIDSSMIVDESFNVSAPFFVYSNINEWREVQIPEDVVSLKDLEQFIDSSYKDRNEPFTFKLEGRAKQAKIHLQNLPEGAIVSSPTEAHQGQLDYELDDRDVKIIGFFSRNHQGVFTHHDSFIHLHLITYDLQMMGHLDAIGISSMRLFISI